MDEPTPPIVQFRKAADASDPKKISPDGIENEETTYDTSDDVMLPKTATSKAGNEDKTLNKVDVLDGGSDGEERTNCTKDTATLMLGIEDRYCSTTWSKLFRVPYWSGGGEVFALFDS